MQVHLICFMGRADTACQHGLARDHVACLSTLKLAERQRRGMCRVDLAAHDARHVAHQGGSGHDRVNTAVRRGTVAAHTLQNHFKIITSRHTGARTRTDLAGVYLRPQVNGKRALHRKRGKVRQQRFGAATLLLGLLETQFDGTLKLVPKLQQQARCGQQHGNVPVMPASMHHAWNMRTIRQMVVVFLDGQRIHIGAQHNHRVLVMPCHGCHHAELSHGHPRDTHFVKFGFDALRRAAFTVRQLWRLVYGAPQAHHVVFTGERGLVNGMQGVHISFEGWRRPSSGRKAHRPRTGPGASSHTAEVPHTGTA